MDARGGQFVLRSDNPRLLLREVLVSSIVQKSPPLRNIPADEETVEMAALAAAVSATTDRAATIWVHRITGIGGGLCLFLALSVWLARAGHYRLVLALLVVSMFAAILHSYTFENGNHN